MKAYKYKLIWKVVSVFNPGSTLKCRLFYLTNSLLTFFSPRHGNFETLAHFIKTMYTYMQCTCIYVNYSFLFPQGCIMFVYLIVGLFVFFNIWIFGCKFTVHINNYIYLLFFGDFL